MTLCTAGFETGTNGATIATTDAGDATAWDSVVVNTGIIAYDTTHFAHGAQAVKVSPNGNAVQTYLQWSAATTGTLTETYGRLYLWVADANGGNANIVQGFDTTPAQAFIIVTKKTAGVNELKLQIVDASGSTNAVGTVAIGLGQWVRIEWHVVANATTGSIEARLYNTADGTTADDTVTLTNCNTRANLALTRFGIVNTNSTGFTGWFDSIATGGATWLGPDTGGYKTVYLSTTAADAAVTVGSDTKKKATGALPGGSSTASNVNTVTGSTAGVQFTDSTVAGTNGTNLSWYTEPLSAVTISGPITWAMWTKESATQANAAAAIRIERCSGDGTVLSTICDASTSQGAGEMPTTAANDTGTISSPTSTTLAGGDRLRISVLADDAADQGGTGTMASGRNTQIWYGANSGQGLATVTFTEALQPYVPPAGTSVTASLFVGTRVGSADASVGLSAYARVASASWDSSSNVGLSSITQAGINIRDVSSSVGLSGYFQQGTTIRDTVLNVGLSGLIPGGSAENPDAALGGFILGGGGLRSGYGVGLSSSIFNGSRAVDSLVSVGLSALIHGGATSPTNLYGIALSSLLAAGVTPRANALNISANSLIEAGALVGQLAIPTYILSGLISVGSALLSSTMNLAYTAQINAGTSVRSSADVGLSSAIRAGVIDWATATNNLSAVATVQAGSTFVNNALALSLSSVTYAGSLIRDAQITLTSLAQISGGINPRLNALGVMQPASISAASGTNANFTIAVTLASPVSVGTLIYVGQPPLQYRVWGTAQISGLYTIEAVASSTTYASTRVGAGSTPQLIVQSAINAGVFAQSNVALSIDTMVKIATGIIPRAVMTPNLQVSSQVSAGVLTHSQPLISVTSSGLIVVSAQPRALASALIDVPTIGLIVAGTQIYALILGAGHGHPTGSFITRQDRATNVTTRQDRTTRVSKLARSTT